MDIVVVGGGKLGEDILHGLIKEGHNLTLIDNDSRVIDDLIDEVDIKGVVGNGVDVEVQREANVQNAQVFIAASPHDEVNIISAMIAIKVIVKMHKMPPKQLVWKALRDFT